MKYRALIGCVVGAMGLWACGDSASSVDATATGSQGSTASSMTTSGGGGEGGGSSTSASGGAGGVETPTFFGSCKDETPPGVAVAPAPKAYTGGECPKLVPGTNTIDSMGNMRSFILVTPTDMQEGERLPVLFLWHWLGAEAKDFLEKGEVQAAADSQRFIAVLPEAKGDITFKWPFDVTVKDERVEEEFVFFDDMLSCVSQQFTVNKECVASAGVSAGALFTDQLAGGRGEYLSSFISLSGGVSSPARPWKEPTHKMPGLVLWGGSTDQCFVVMNFETCSKQLEKDLEANGHFFVECVHNCGHSEPPIDAPDGLSKFASLWQFVFDHPYWLKPGLSPYQNDGLPKDLPGWCGIGAASATPRTGECLNDPGC